ncbi:hypothetical protein [Kouleothrix sp.]|uniref:hypothetical protein n=1 Tax=Kouleothrix sp. TaxID=2779161 RepID=UPI0039191FA5
MKPTRVLLGALLLGATLAACDVSPSAPAGGTASPSQPTAASQPGQAPATPYPAPADAGYPAPNADGTYPAPTSAP